MLLSTQTDVVVDKIGREETIRLLAEAGFDAYDLSLFEMKNEGDGAFQGEDYAENARKLREFTDKIGIVCNQAHAPFPSAVGDEEKDAWIFERIVRSMEIASIAGAKIIVVHPIKDKTVPYPRNRETLKRRNLEFYRKLVPYCEKFGIRVAVENMWQYDRTGKKIVDSVCSSGEEFREYVDEVGSPWIVACLDWGHVPLVGRDPAELIRALGKDRLRALHVHDNDSLRDDHTLPYLRSQDCDEYCDLLAEIGYEGDLTFEADNFYRNMPIELLPTAMKFMHDVGRYMIARIEKKL